MHRKISTPTIQANRDWRKNHYGWCVEIFFSRKVDVHFCREHPHIGGLTESARHTAPLNLGGVRVDRGLIVHLDITKCKRQSLRHSGEKNRKGVRVFWRQFSA